MHARAKGRTTKADPTATITIPMASRRSLKESGEKGWTRRDGGGGEKLEKM